MEKAKWQEQMETAEAAKVLAESQILILEWFFHDDPDMSVVFLPEENNLVVVTDNPFPLRTMRRFVANFIMSAEWAMDKGDTPMASYGGWTLRFEKP